MPDPSWDNTIDLGYLVTRYRDTAEGVIDYGIGLVAKGAVRDIPKDTGRTARSVTTKRTGLRGAVGFRSSKAVPLHENTSERHPRGGRAKFLETNLVGSTAAIRRRAVADFRAATQEGAR